MMNNSRSIFGSVRYEATGSNMGIVSVRLSRKSTGSRIFFMEAKYALLFPSVSCRGSNSVMAGAPLREAQGIRGGQ